MLTPAGSASWIVAAAFPPIGNIENDIGVALWFAGLIAWSLLSVVAVVLAHMAWRSRTGATVRATVLTALVAGYCIVLLTGFSWAVLALLITSPMVGGDPPP